MEVSRRRQRERRSFYFVSFAICARQLWHSFSTRRFKKPIPLVARQMNFLRLRRFADALGLGRADDRHDVRRMFQQPGKRNDRSAHTVVARDFIKRLAQTDAPRVVGTIDIDRQHVTEPPAGERTPREQRDLFRHALLDRAVLKTIELRQTYLYL